MARQLMRLQQSHEQQRKHHQWGHWAEKRDQGSQAGGWGQLTAWDLEQKAAVQQNASHSQVLPCKHWKAHHQLLDAYQLAGLPKIRIRIKINRAN
jgi:hypothetical protein